MPPPQLDQQKIPRILIQAGTFVVLGYAVAMILFQSAQMWVAASVITARWKGVSDIAYAVFSPRWLNAFPQNEDATWVWIKGVYVVLMAALFAGYLLAVGRVYKSQGFTAENSRNALRFVVMITGIALLMLLVGRGMLSSDVHSYVWYGRIPALEGGNPYIDTPQEYIGRDAEGWMEWEVWNGTLPSVYGPLWIFLAEGVTFLAQAVGGKELAIHVLGHRLLSDAAHLINIWLVWKVAGEIARRVLIRGGREPDERTRAAWQLGAAITYAWNPLVMFEFGLSGHNDSIMIFFLLVTVLLLLQGMWRWAAVALAGAAMVKLTALLFLPFYLIWVWRKWWNAQTHYGLDSGPNEMRERGIRVGQSLVIMVGISLVMLWPFGGPWPLLEAVSTNPAARQHTNSIAAFVIEVLGINGEWAQWVRWGQQALAIVLLAVVTWRTWAASQKGVHPIIEGWGWAIMVYLLVGSPWFWPWYATWLFVPLALLWPGRLWTAGQVLAMSAMVVYALFPVPAGQEDIADFSGLIVVGPVLIFLVWSWLPRPIWLNSP